MLQIVNAIFSLTGQVHKSEITAEERVSKIFDQMDTVRNFLHENFIYSCIFLIQDGNGEISKEEFLIGAKQDKTILAAIAFNNSLTE